MKDKIFLDSNILIYLIGDNKEKKLIVKDLIKKNPVISTQVFNEMANVLNKKFKLDFQTILNIVNRLAEECEVTFIYLETIKSALNIAQKYKYSYFDSLIISSTLENNCKILYTEDMQDGQLIEGKVIIKNPF